MDALVESLINLAMRWEQEWEREGDFVRHECSQELREVLKQQRVGAWSKEKRA